MQADNINQVSSDEAGIKKVQFLDWGLIDYKEAWDKQEALFDETVRIKTLNRDNKDGIQQPTNDYLIFASIRMFIH